MLNNPRKGKMHLPSYRRGPALSEMTSFSAAKPLSPLESQIASILADILVADIKSERSVPDGELTERTISD